MDYQSLKMIKIKCAKRDIKNIDKFLLKNNFDLPIFWDESYTSVEAEDITKDFFKNSKEQNRHIDKFAAKLVLDDFFNENLDEKKITESLRH